MLRIEPTGNKTQAGVHHHGHDRAFPDQLSPVRALYLDRVTIEWPLQQSKQCSLRTTYGTRRRHPKSGLPEAFATLGRGAVLGIQYPILIMLMVFLAAHVLLTQFPLGRYFFGLGGNEEALRLSGVRVQRCKFIAYVLSGIAAALSGIVLSSRLMSGQPNAGIGKRAR